MNEETILNPEFGYGVLRQTYNPNIWIMFEVQLATQTINPIIIMYNNYTTCSKIAIISQPLNKSFKDITNHIAKTKTSEVLVSFEQFLTRYNLELNILDDIQSSLIYPYAHMTIFSVQDVFYICERYGMMMERMRSLGRLTNITLDVSDYIDREIKYCNGFILKKPIATLKIGVPRCL